MRFGTLEIEAFLTIGEAKVELDGRGLTHISGESDETAADSNGAGKSSVADAIAWACWGETARGVTGDEVINATLGKGTRVALPIIDGADRYEIVRHRKNGKHKNALQVFSNGVEITKGTTSETQKLIQRILGCSMEVFNASIYMGQEQMPDLPAMTDKPLKVLVEQAAGVDVLTDAYDTARERLRDAVNARATAQMSYDRANDRHSMVRDQIARAGVQRDDWTQQQHARVQRARTAALDAATAAKAAKDTYNPQEAADLRTAIATSEKTIASVSAERDRERLLAHEASETMGVLSIAKTRVNTAEEAVKRTKRACDAVKSNVGKPCGECGKPHTEADLVQAQKLADAKLAEAGEQYKTLVAARAAAQKLADGAGAALEAHRATMTDVSMEAAKLQAFRSELAVTENVAREIQRAIEGANTAANEMKRIAAETNPYDSTLAQLDAQLVSAAADCNDAEKVLADADEEAQYKQAVVDVFAPAGVRAHRLDEATPYLNDRTAHYLGSLTDGAIEAYWTTLTLSKDGKTLQEKFSIAVEKKGGGGSFRSLSGGEKRKVRLSCALALQDLVTSRSPKSVELWCGDEVDDALDPAGLERLMGILEEKAREKGTVLIISHNDIAHYARQTLIVSKKNGVSTVRTA